MNHREADMRTEWAYLNNEWAAVCATTCHQLWSHPSKSFQWAMPQLIFNRNDRNSNSNSSCNNSTSFPKCKCLFPVLPSSNNSSSSCCCCSTRVMKRLKLCPRWTDLKCWRLVARTGTIPSMLWVMQTVRSSIVTFRFINYAAMAASKVAEVPPPYRRWPTPAEQLVIIINLNSWLREIVKNDHR